MSECVYVCVCVCVCVCVFASVRVWTYACESVVWGTEVRKMGLEKENENGTKKEDVWERDYKIKTVVIMLDPAIYGT